MNAVQTMRIGAIELRKTDGGWQYLIEGIENEPDHWCDATSFLGPLGGSGTNNLLDELLAARIQAEQKAASVCQNCIHWGDYYEGCCNFIDTIHGECVADTTGCQIIVKVSDDSGLDARLKTGPDFSCPNFKGA